MAAKKNTAQAYEVLYRMAQEKEAEAKRKRKAASPGTTAPEAPLTAPAMEPAAAARSEAPPPRFDRAPLLEAERGHDGNRERPSRQRLRRRATPPEALAREAAFAPGSSEPGRRGGARSLLAQLDAARTRARESAPPPFVELPPPESPDADRVAAEARELLLRDDFSESLPPGPADLLPLAATDTLAWPDARPSAVDPVLLGKEETVSWGSARRVRYLEAAEPVLAAARSEDLADRAELAGRADGAASSPEISARASPPWQAKAEEELSRVVPQPRETPDQATVAAVETSPRPASAAITVGGQTGGQADGLPGPGQRSLGQSSLRQGTVWARLRGVGAWILGDGSTRLLAQRFEIKVSTALVLAMSGIVVTTLVLTYLRLPGPEDPLYRARSTPSFARAPASSATPAELPPTQPPALPPNQPPGVRHFPRWGPGMSEADGGTGAAPARAALPTPEIRDIVTARRTEEPLAPTPDAREPASPTLQAPVPAPAAVPAAASELAPRYVIQVRAKESLEGADRIGEYLSLFGFEKPLLEEDSRGDRTAAGDKLYTVFVGHYSDRAEAQRECDRLKRETRGRAYKGHREFFQDCLVITRGR